MITEKELISELAEGLPGWCKLTPKDRGLLLAAISCVSGQEQRVNLSANIVHAWKLRHTSV
jgi:hypothetical protein